MQIIYRNQFSVFYSNNSPLNIIVLLANQNLNSIMEVDGYQWKDGFLQIDEVGGTYVRCLVKVTKVGIEIKDLKVGMPIR